MADHRMTEPTTETIDISTILIDDRFQIRKSTERAAIARYSKAYTAGKELPPIKLVRVGDALILADGFHRCEALRQIGKLSVDAIINHGTERDVLWIGAQSNLENGLHLRSSEIRGVFHSYIDAGQHIGKHGKLKSYREIAADLGNARGHVTIRNWMKKDYPRIFKRMGGTSPDSFHGKGGLPDRSSPSTAEVVREYLGESFRAMQAITDRKER